MDRRTEYLIVYDYLKNNLTFRALCAKYSKIRDNIGFRSWDIINKKYCLKKEDRGILFSFSKSEVKKIVNMIIKTKNREVLENIRYPKKIENYGDSYIVAPSEKDAYQILNGELRNLVQFVFFSYKGEQKYCQYKNCRNTNLEVAHHHTRGRKDLFLRIARKHKFRVDRSHFKFDVREIMLEFINSHVISHKHDVLFLCKKHHTQYDSLKTISVQNEFVKLII
jgi:hypothetical protein